MAVGKDYPVVGNENLGYLFEFKPDGVFLTIYPSGNAGAMFELSDMRQILEERGVSDYDIDVLARTVREASGRPQRLSSIDASAFAAVLAEESPSPYGRVVITVDRNRMEAKVHREIPNGTLPPTVAMIKAALVEKGIKFGIDNEAIEKGAARSGDFIAARGIPAVDGKNARIERNFDMSNKGKPRRNEYDQVDYKDMNLFVLAKKGDILAERIPQTQGTPGTDVYGNEVRQKQGRPIPLPNGKNTEVKDENYVVAMIEGQIIDTGSKISVEPQLEIRSDVGVSTGNIDFTGGVSVVGNVQTGFVLKATGDVEIKGAINGGSVEARNIRVNGGILGMNRGKVKATESVEALFAENADIESDGSIFIKDVVLHSNLRAAYKIIVEGKRGLVTGGYLAAGEEIQARVIGNAMNVVTRLNVGINPMQQRQYQAACKEYKESKQRLDQVMKALATLEKLDLSNLPPDRAEQVQRLKMSQFPLAGKVERSKKEVARLNDELLKMEKGRVRVSDTIYPGTRLSINTVMKNIQDELKHCTLSVEGDYIRSGPY